MKMLKFLTLSLLVLMTAGIAQAGFITPGLESQLQTMQDDDYVKVLVVMKQQADIRELDWQLHDQKAGLDYRHKMVVETLQRQAKESQDALLGDLNSAKAGGDVLGFSEHWIVNSVVVKATVAKVRELSRRADVERIEADLVVELIEPVDQKDVVADRNNRGIGITPGVVAVGARRVWNELGINGNGVIVGVLDTGVDGNHVALTDRWQGNFSNPDYCWIDAAGLGHETPQDSHGHGSHVMGTITGLAADDTIGVAPGATWIASNVINMSTGGDFDNGVLVSLEFMTDPDGNPQTTADLPAVVQNSWGVNENFPNYYDCDSRWWDAIDNCEAAGVVLTWSAGNEGPGAQSMRSPADRAASPTNCFSVGSTLTSAPYTISSFSSRGPSGCGGEWAMKPEIVAPGSDIYSVQAGGGYTYMSGTSMAGPHLAGVVALMRAANPDLDVITVKQILMDTAIDLGPAGEDNTYGHGFVDAYEAVLAVMDGVGTVAGYVTDSATGQPIEGAVVRKVGANNRATTDANGYYSMTMPAGAADFTVTYFGYNEGNFSVTIPDDNSTVNGDYSLVQLPTATVSGVVYGPSGELVAGATISALDTPLDPAVSDLNGAYSLALPQGETFVLRGRANGLGFQTQTVEVTGNLTLDFNLPVLTAEDFESGDFASYPWVMGTNPWVISTNSPYEGQYCAKSGNIGDGQSSAMSVTWDFFQNTPLTFMYKVSSENGYDFLRFSVDGAEVASWSGNVSWTMHEVEIPAGTHTLTWTYTKDGSVSHGDDAGYVDFIDFNPGTPVIALSAESFAATVEVGGMTDQTLTISNNGDTDLRYGLSLYEIDPMQTAPQASIEPMELAKGESDPRVGQSPLTGSGGPDAFGYTWMDSDEAGGPVYNWIDISGTGTVPGSGDDGNFGPFELGFDFTFYGQTFDSVNICTNGWLSFTSTVASFNNQGIPNSGQPNNLVAPFWDDMNPSAGGAIYYEARDSQFIVQYEAVPHYYDSNPETFQVIFNNDGSIVFQYKIVSAGEGCTVGIENGAGDDGLEVVANANYLHDELAIRFATVPPLTWVTADPVGGTVSVGGSEDVTLHFDATGLSAGTYEAMLVVSSNDPTNSVLELPVTMVVTDGLSAVQGLPTALHLQGAVPNPFNPMTDIKFSLPREARVSLKIYDISGRLGS